MCFCVDKDVMRAVKYEKMQEDGSWSSLNLSVAFLEGRFMYEML